MGRKKLYRISEVTKLLGVTRSALHGYDEKGILSPTLRKGEGGYWYYDEEALIKLKLIEIFKEAGCSRKEIKKYLSTKGSLNQALEETKSHLEEKRKQLVKEICFLEVMVKLGIALQDVSSSNVDFQHKIREVKEFFGLFSYETGEEADDFIEALVIALAGKKKEE